MKSENKRKVLAISSGGGHWVQLLRLRPAWEGHDVVYVTVNASYRSDVPGNRFRIIKDATRWNKFALVLSGLQILWVLISEKPDVIVSTGAAPGYIAIRIGKIFKKKTMWLDSIANVDELSLSGKEIGKYADLWLTQWPHLESPEGPAHKGSVL